MNIESQKDTRQSLTEQCYEKLRGAILTNELAPDSFWSDREFCDAFDVSRTPVREALLRLQTENLVQIVPRRGTRILPLSTKDVKEIHQVTKALELEAVLQIARMDDRSEVLSVLAQCVSDMQSAIEAEDRDSWAKADTRFHYTVVDFCGNGRIRDMYHAQRGLTDRARYFALRLRALPRQSTEEHRQMYEALLDADSRQLEVLYRQHWDRTTEEMLALITEHSQGRNISGPSVSA